MADAVTALQSAGRRWGQRVREAARSGSVPMPLLELALALRGVLFAGRRFRCPCCGWRLRAFTRGGASLRSRPEGYCARCDAKARHRRIWLFLEQERLLAGRLRLLEVAPKYAFARRLARMPNIDYVGAGLDPGPYVSVITDLAASSLPASSFDGAICVHVLEEIVDDRAAMRELARVLRPGGWALVTVPTNLDQPTYEDWSITSPQARNRAFGERAHVRVYGADLVDRLRSAGFVVRVDLARDLDPAAARRYGLKFDENIFLCTKPIQPAAEDRA